MCEEEPEELAALAAPDAPAAAAPATAPATPAAPAAAAAAVARAPLLKLAMHAALVVALHATCDAAGIEPQIEPQG